MSQNTISHVPCIILAGGYGTRLRSILKNKPKCLAPIGDKSFLEIQIEQLHKYGIEKFILSLGYKAEEVIKKISKIKKNYNLEYFVEEAPLGTGGSVKNILDIINCDEVLVINGDTFLNGEISSMLSPLNLNKHELFRMATINVQNRSRYGGVKIKNNMITNFIPKGSKINGPINAGFYRLRKSIFSILDLGDSFSMEKGILPLLIQKKYIFGTEITGDFIDIGIPEDYKSFNDLYIKL